MKLDLGCGKRGTKYDGFTGVDIRGKPSDTHIVHDLRERLPFDDESVDEIVCLHVLEHFTRPEAVGICKEIFRILKSGMVATIAVPDLRLFAKMYLAEDYAFFMQNYPNSNIPIWKGAELADKFLDSIIGMGRNGHKYAYDLYSLKELLHEAGFTGWMSPAPTCSKYATRDHEIVIEVVK